MRAEPVKIRVILADDHAVVRDGMRALLEAQGDILVVGDAADGRAAVRQAAALQPDIVLMDIAMPLLNGIDAAEQILSESAATRVVILSMHASSEHISRALQAGAQGYLLKESLGQEVVAAVRAVHAGQRYLSARITETLVDDYLSQVEGGEVRSPLERLSLREREVLQLVVEGRTNAEVAALLSLSIRTVETYRSRLMSKLEVHDLPGLVKFALQHGLISLD